MGSRSPKAEDFMSFMMVLWTGQKHLFTICLTKSRGLVQSRSSGRSSSQPESRTNRCTGERERGWPSSRRTRVHTYRYNIYIYIYICHNCSCSQQSNSQGSCQPFSSWASATLQSIQKSDLPARAPAALQNHLQKRIDM